MEFDKKLVYRADFVMENSVIKKMRNLSSRRDSNFRSALKSLCDEYGIRADSVLIIHEEQDLNKETFYDICKDKGLNKSESSRAYSKYTEICGTTWDLTTALEVISSYT